MDDENTGDPNRFLRHAGYPAGLRNVGNTCYVNSILQTCFSLGDVLQDVLNSHDRQPSATLAGSAVAPENSDAATVTAMDSEGAVVFGPQQKALGPQLPSSFEQTALLFARMLLSIRRYVDPKPCLDELRIAYGEQQDASEFFTMLFEKVPFLQQHFQGKFHHETVLIDGTVSSSSDEQFLQLVLALSADGPNSVYDCLDELLHTVVEVRDEAGETKRGIKRSEISELPNVLLLQLQRASYDVNQKRAVKNVTPVTFDDILYLDRYHASNHEDAVVHREELSRLRSARKEVVANINGLLPPPQVAQVREFVSASDLSSEGQHVAAYLAQVETLLEKRKMELESQRSLIDSHIASVFAEDKWKQMSYCLHSILVHSGSESTSGHYYVLQRDSRSPQGVILISDINVEINPTVDWSNVRENAYCAVYVRTDKPQMSLNQVSVPHILRARVDEENGSLREKCLQYSAEFHALANVGLGGKLLKQSSCYEAAMSFLRALRWIVIIPGSQSGAQNMREEVEAFFGVALLSFIESLPPSSSMPSPEAGLALELIAYLRQCLSQPPSPWMLERLQALLQKKNYSNLLDNMAVQPTSLPMISEQFVGADLNTKESARRSAMACKEYVCSTFRIRISHLSAKMYAAIIDAEGRNESKASPQDTFGA
jgi:hypothetical protein